MSSVAAGGLARFGNATLLDRPLSGAPLLTAAQAAFRARRRQYEVRQLVEERQRIEDQLRVANQRKDELLALASHELRTPLTIIVGSADVLRRREDELELSTRKELLHRVLESANNLTRIVENMLVLAKAELLPGARLEPFLVQRLLPPIVESLRPLKGLRERRYVGVATCHRYWATRCFSIRSSETWCGTPRNIVRRVRL